MNYLTTRQLSRLVNDRLTKKLLIHVGDPSDFEKVHLPYSLNLPFLDGDFVMNMRRLSFGRHDVTVLYDHEPASKRVSSAYGALKEQNLNEDVKLYDAGMQVWREGGGRVSIPKSEYVYMIRDAV